MTHHAPQRSAHGDDLLSQARGLAHHFEKQDGRPGAASVINLLVAEIEKLRDASARLLEVVEAIPGTPDEEPETPCTDLCGNAWCEQFGCIPQKMIEARAAIAGAKVQP